MSKDPFVRFEQQMRRAIRDGAVPDKRTLWRTPSALVAVLGVSLLSGGAFAATRLAGDGQSVETQGRKIAIQAIRESQKTPACRLDNEIAGLSDATPLPAITRLLPLIGAPADPPSVLGPQALGRVLRSSIHRRRLPGGYLVTVYVADRGGLGGVRDPEGCRTARSERADKLLQGRPDGVAEWARRRLAQFVDVAPDVQTLWVLTSTPRGRARAERAGVPLGGGGGAGLPIGKDRPARPGPVSSTTIGTRGTLYTGITAPGATAVRILPQRRVRPFTRKVVDGLYVALIPRRTGRTQLQELDTDGRVLRTVRVR